MSSYTPPPVIQHAGVKYFSNKTREKITRFANPAPIALFAFSLTTFLLSIINARARNVSINNIAVGPAFFYGGLVQIIGGIFEFACGNTFGATAFCSYGAFWMALAGTLTPSFGVLAAYTAQGVPEQELNDALGLFLIGWMIFTFIMLLASLNTSWGLICILSLLDLTFALLAASYFVATSHPTIALNLTKAGGIFGLLVAFNGWLLSMSAVLPADHFMKLPMGNRSHVYRKDPVDGAIIGKQQ